ncbi:Glycosyltransferase involved in cell wall bisynthesis [Salinimicrobium sediminis]|uniref:Glycosyltransferase involved in cell wall bisynthesis n=1 Tax=Salinimicrobium sediminis TaxID=1343891 RepID=A0A285X2C3_9FLAO|nr:glycosyltransferase family 4 protein [Salinimicrobium sediminis]SOC79493.1 Glycosyltransferase involved in cell wall bisynthesis [Salinimicrobium sediminis]
MEDKKMKVLMTTDTVGGVWVYSLELCRALEQYGVQVHLVAMGGWPSPAQQVEAEEIPNVTFYKSDYKLEWMKNPWKDVEQSRKWINCIYTTVQPDIVHFNNYAHVEEDWTAPVVTVFHSCVQTWWQAVKGKAAPQEWDQYTRTVKESLQASDIVVGPTQAILNKAQQAHGFTSEIKVIHNGRSINPAEAKPKEEMILCMGRMWDEAKNLPLLSKIAAKLPWPVYVAGEAVNPDTGVKCRLENVKFLGKLSAEEVQHWMQRASIFVSPTRYEPFGLAILEAAGNGCALVLSNLETLKELWQDVALFFDPEDEVEAEKTVLRLLESPQFLQELSEKAKERAATYSIDKMGAAYHRLYHEIMEKEQKLMSI